MVIGVCLTPIPVGGQGHHAEPEANAVRDFLRLEERSVPTVVLDQEEAHHKAGSRYSEDQGEPIADRKGAVGRVPKNEERNGRRKDLGQTTSKVCAAIRP